MVVGDEVNIFLWADMLEAVVSPLYKGFASPQQIEELLREAYPAFRPKPAANAARHNPYVIILIAHSKFLKTKNTIKMVALPAIKKPRIRYGAL